MYIYMHIFLYIRIIMTIFILIIIDTARRVGEHRLSDHHQLPIALEHDLEVVLVACIININGKTRII